MEGSYIKLFLENKNIFLFNLPFGSVFMHYIFKIDTVVPCYPQQTGSRTTPQISKFIYAQVLYIKQHSICI